MDNFGFLKVAAAVPHVRVADCDYNTERMAAMAEEAAGGASRSWRSPNWASRPTPAAISCCSRRCSTPADEGVGTPGARHAQTPPHADRRRSPAPRVDALQLRRGLHARQSAGRGSQNLYPRLRGVLRKPLVRVGAPGFPTSISPSRGSRPTSAPTSRSKSTARSSASRSARTSGPPHRPRRSWRSTARR